MPTLGWDDIPGSTCQQYQQKTQTGSKLYTLCNNCNVDLFFETYNATCAISVKVQVLCNTCETTYGGTDFPVTSQTLPKSIIDKTESTNLITENITPTRYSSSTHASQEPFNNDFNKITTKTKKLNQTNDVTYLATTFLKNSTEESISDTRMSNTRKNEIISTIPGMMTHESIKTEIISPFETTQPVFAFPTTEYTNPITTKINRTSHNEIITISVDQQTTWKNEIISTIPGLMTHDSIKTEIISPFETNPITTEIIPTTHYEISTTEKTIMTDDSTTTDECEEEESEQTETEFSTTESFKTTTISTIETISQISTQNIKLS